MSTIDSERTRGGYARVRDENRSDDDRQRRDPLDWLQGTPPERPPRGFLDKRRWVETKSSFRTSELLVLILSVTGILIASSQVEDLDARWAWTLVTAVAVGYLLSRGIAKSGKGTYVDD
jgi:hypothetical protein